MKILKRFGYAVSAAALCLCSLQLPADADALDPGAWRIREYYQVNSDGVFGYTYDYVMRGGEKKIEYSLNKGDIVYAGTGYSSMGITWASCSNWDEHEPGCIFYGLVDMAYLSPVGSVYDEPEPEPETDPPTDPPTEPPTEPTTEPPTTIATTKKITTKKITTMATTVLTTIEEITEEETTEPTTTYITTTENAEIIIKDDNNDDHKNDFISDNFAFILIGCVVILAASSGLLAIGLIYRSNKKSKFIPMQAGATNEYKDVKTCPQCGTQLSKNATFCGQCGSKLNLQTKQIFEQADVKICPQCGAQLPKNATFCGKCGSKLH